MPRIKEALGLQDPSNVFKNAWVEHGFPRTVKSDEGGATTPTLQDMFRKEANRERNFWQKRLHQKLSKASKTETKGYIDASVMQDSIPIIFDPEILTILKEESPILARLPSEGYEGYTVVSNRIDDFGEPLGMAAEGDVLDLSGETGNEYTMNKVERAMKIYHDVVSISDFTQRAGEHYTSIKDTSMGMKMAAHANFKAKQVLYGDPSQGLTDGSIGSANAYDGLMQYYPNEDKSAVDLSGDQALLKDIKGEVKDLLQSGKNVLKSDLEIWTSHSIFDKLENEMGVKAFILHDADGFNYGYEQIHIKDIPVIADQNVAEHTADDGTSTYTVGSDGDVFIVNKRSARFRSLAPLSTLPLARVGLADRAVIYEYGTLIERSNGQWGKYLSGYSW